MFELLYWHRYLDVIEKHPKEIIGAIAAVWITTDITSRIADVKKAKIQALSEEHTAELRVIAARLELELAQLKLDNMPDTE